MNPRLRILLPALAALPLLAARGANDHTEWTWGGKSVAGAAKVTVDEPSSQRPH